MAILKIKDETGKFVDIPAIQGPPGKDGAIQYEAGEGIKIDGNVISATNIPTYDMFGTNDFDSTFTTHKKSFIDFLNNNFGRNVCLIVGYGSKFYICYLKVDATNKTLVCLSYPVDGTVAIYLYGTTLYYRPTFDITTGKITDVSVSISSSTQLFATTNNISSQCITKTNTTAYTPTSDYHPATYKFVKDEIAAAITTTLEGEY